MATVTGTSIVIRVFARGKEYQAVEHQGQFGPYFQGPEYLPTPDYQAVLDSIARDEFVGDALDGAMGSVSCRWELVSRSGKPAPKLIADHDAYRRNLLKRIEDGRALNPHGGVASGVAKAAGFDSLAQLDRYIDGKVAIPNQFVPICFLRHATHG